jgi:hypothetical protein
MPTVRLMQDTGRNVDIPSVVRLFGYSASVFIGPGIIATVFAFTLSGGISNGRYAMTLFRHRICRVLNLHFVQDIL